MSHPDVRWQQRFSNYRRALEQLDGFLEPPSLNEREQQGLINAFEYTFEYTFELAWMLMIPDRNLTSHTYNRGTAIEIGAHIRDVYLNCFQALRCRLDQRPASDVDLCLTGDTLAHGDLLRIMASVDELLEHINRVGRCIWRQA